MAPDFDAPLADGEVAIKSSLGKLTIDAPSVGEFFEEQMDENSPLRCPSCAFNESCAGWRIGPGVAPTIRLP
jgi:hypothetical protein